MFTAAKALPQEKTFIQQFWLFKRLLILKLQTGLSMIGFTSDVFQYSVNYTLQHYHIRNVSFYTVQRYY